MSDRKLIGIVVSVTVGLALILSLGIVISKNVKSAAREEEIAAREEEIAAREEEIAAREEEIAARKEETAAREQGIVALATDLGNAISNSNHHIQRREFDQAESRIRRLERYILTVNDSKLKDRYDQALARVTVAKRDNEAQVENGWTVFESKFISPNDRNRILDDRERKRQDEHRVVEQKVAAARQLRAKRREAEELRRAEEKRKAMQVTAITWAHYVADCGVKAQQKNEARSEKTFQQKYEGKRIRWAGRVVSIDSVLLSNNFVITAKMSPSDESIYSDLHLSIPQAFESVVMPLNQGDIVEFVGTIQMQGGPLLRHVIQCEQIRKK